MLLALKNAEREWWLVNPEGVLQDVSLWVSSAEKMLAAGVSFDGRLYLPASLGEALAGTLFPPACLLAPRLNQGFWVLDAGVFARVLSDLDGPQGEMVCAVFDDADAAGELLMGFCKEALPHQARDPLQLKQRLLQKIEVGHLYLWKAAGKAVAMAAEVRRTQGVSAISWVYTRPEYRGQRFAFALMGALSQRLLQEGRTCCLFTDLNNPVSGHVYKKLGYRQHEQWLTLSLD